MRLLAVDPGSSQSGFVVVDAESPESLYVLSSGTCLNEDMLSSEGIVRDHPGLDALVIEEITPFSAGAGISTRDTIFFSGRLYQLWNSVRPGPAQLVPRHRVRSVLGVPVKKSDGSIKRALEYRYGHPGGQKCTQCKGKAWVGRDHDPCPLCLDHPGMRTPRGILYGVTGHALQALALAVTYLSDTEKK